MQVAPRSNVPLQRRIKIRFGEVAHIDFAEDLAPHDQRNIAVDTCMTDDQWRKGSWRQVTDGLDGKRCT